MCVVHVDVINFAKFGVGAFEGFRRAKVSSDFPRQEIKSSLQLRYSTTQC